MMHSNLMQTVVPKMVESFADSGSGIIGGECERTFFADMGQQKQAVNTSVTY